jgi:transposase
LNNDIERICASDAACQRLQQIPGIGPLVGSALVAAIGNGAAFRRGRDLSAWLSLVPKQYSTGGKAKLLGISKRGNRYLRTMFIHGARAAVVRLRREGTRWVSGWTDWRLEHRATCWSSPSPIS